MQTKVDKHDNIIVRLQVDRSSFCEQQLRRFDSALPNLSTDSSSNHDNYYTLQQQSILPCEILEDSLFLLETLPLRSFISARHLVQSGPRIRSIVLHSSNLNPTLQTKSQCHFLRLVPIVRAINLLPTFIGLKNSWCHRRTPQATTVRVPTP